jgi:DNA-binding transcriptional LysR family regulator
VRLFERARDGYTPTPAGEAAIGAASSLLDGLATLQHQLAGEDLRPSGVVRVTTTDTLVDFLSPGLAAFRAAHREITVELVAANAFFTLTRRDADVAIRPSLTVPDQLAGRRIAAIAMAPYAAPAYLATRREVGSLEAHDWLGFDESLAHLGSAIWMRKHVPPERIAFRSSSLLALRAAARAGLGVAPLPCYLGDADPALSRLGPAIPEMASALWLLTHPDMRRVARIRAFLDFMAPWLEQRRDLLEGNG